MRFNIKHFLLLSVFSLGANANPSAPNAAQIDIMIDMMESHGGLAGPAKCLGKTEAETKSLMKKGFQQCLALMNEEGDEFDNCMTTSLEKNAGISRSQLEKCEQLANDESSLQKENHESALEKQIATVSDKIGALESKEQLSSPEKHQLKVLNAQLEELSAQQMQEMNQAFEADMAQMIALSSATAKADPEALNNISLPIYPKSEVISHFKNGMDMGEMLDGVHALPTASFYSSDTVATILSFYKAKLPSYKVQSLDNNEYILMKTMPKDFDYLKHTQQYLTTPHIMIKPEIKGIGILKNAKSIIEIAYKKTNN